MYFIGGVVRPGPMQLTQDLTLLRAPPAAGGPAPSADLESASGPSRSGADSDQSVEDDPEADVSQNTRLQPGDTIVVPNAELVYIRGEVEVPGQIKFTKDLTIVTAIAAAGGFTPAASENKVRVLRGEGPKREVLKVKVSDIVSDPSESADVRSSSPTTSSSFLRGSSSRA